MNFRQYFNRAICQSGVVCTESFFQVEPSTKARKLAKALGYRGDSDLGVLGKCDYVGHFKKMIEETFVCLAR